MKSAVALLSRILSQFTTEEQISKLEVFVKSIEVEHGPFPGTYKAITNARKDLKWAEKNVPAIKTYLQPNMQSGASPSAVMGLSAITCAVALACLRIFI